MYTVIIPKISIIVPIYNVEACITSCLDSLITQTLSDIEIICVDDGSPDQSVQIVQQYMKQDTRIRLIRQSNQGLSSARNTGLLHVRAEYVMFCDSDDTYAPIMCETMYNVITTNNVDLGICGVSVHYLANLELKEFDLKYFAIPCEGNVENVHDILKNTNCSAWNKLFKMSIIRNYDIVFPVKLKYEDNAFFFQYTSVCKSSYFTQEQLYHYYRRDGSIMNQTYSKNLIALDRLKILTPMYDFSIRTQTFKRMRNYFASSILYSYSFSYRYLPDDKKHLANDALRDFLSSLPPSHRCYLIISILYAIIVRIVKSLLRRINRNRKTS